MQHQAGFTLIEVLVAMAILIAAALMIAELVTVAVQAAQTARAQTMCTMLAVQKMEQLKALTWGYVSDEITAPSLGDAATDLSYDPPRTGGGGLAPSPAGALDRNTPGYVDFLDAEGRWVGTGSTPPVAAVYARRWSIGSLAFDADDSRVLQVLVTRTGVDARLSAAMGIRPVLAGDALLSGVLTRRLP